MRDFGVGEKDVGFYAGFAEGAAAFMLGRAMPSVAWGAIADRIGPNDMFLNDIDINQSVTFLIEITRIVLKIIFGLRVITGWRSPQGIHYYRSAASAKPSSVAPATEGVIFSGLEGNRTHPFHQATA
ncbi:hypothetical protein MLD38_020099 [Melastoma candidum]|uniref:Uncharacterized protein n=1 Tax=Melastoma candidum TaxID=119954 RepID=A0ACB9QBW8_9MYRT|nr:hypothetical protein MLD38_020099 [Melastoma candidum]